LWLIVELLTAICAPVSPSMPATELPQNTDRLMMTLLPVARRP
jgi:hypothetical protein